MGSVESLSFAAPGPAAAGPGDRSVLRDGAGSTDSISSGCPVKHGASPSAAGPSSGGCPVKHGASSSGAPTDAAAKKGESSASSPGVYNVYAEKIDPTNQMPGNQKQQPFPGQRYPLSTERAQSSIAKGGTNGTWQYPSPQQFYNALMRKGKGEDVSEDDVDMVVSIHNNMNERAWKQLLVWESKYCDECPAGPRLSRFMGRPDDVTPKAWLKSFLGYGLPFDRHDWIIDRCGKEVRYVIDYYYDSAKADGDQKPTLESTRDIQSITMDVRPALDSPGSAMDRARMCFADVGAVAEQRQSPPAAAAAGPEGGAAVTTAAAEAGTEADSGDMDAVFDRVKSRCGKCMFAVSNCESPTACYEASVDLKTCLGNIICPDEARAFEAARAELTVGSGDVAKGVAMEKSIEAFAAMSAKLDAFEAKHAPR